MHASNITPTLLLTATVLVMLAVVSASPVVKPVVKPMVKSAYPFANIHTNDPVHAREEVLSRVKRQDISDRCNLADIIFVLDSSGSIGQDNWVKVLNFTKSIAGGFVIGPEEVQIGVVYYGNRARVAFHLNAYTNAAEVSNAIDAIQWLDQNTNTSGGIWMMNENMFTAENGKRDGVPALGIVITDGVSTRDPQFTIPSADAARANNILMFAIGITDQIDLDELEGIANKPSEDFVFEADDFNALASIRDQVVQAACKAASECSENGDVVMLLDASGSVGFDNFQLAKNFVESLVMDANIDNGEARIGLATYASSVDVQFHLNTYNDRILMADAVRNIPYSQGTTNTGAAIQRARQDMFTAGNGNRSDRRDTLVIFTDGGSDDMANTLQQAKLIKQAGVTVLVVAVGSWTNKREIELMVSYPAELNTFSVSSFEDFASIKRPLEQSVCNDGAECSQGTCMNGGVCQDGINTFFCDCPQGYSGDRCQYTCNSNADVSIVLQSSSSLGEEDYYTMLKYSQAIARNLNLVSGQHRLAMETYATSPTARFRLNQFQSARDVLTELDFQYTGGVTNTQGALRTMNDDLLSNGGRSGVAKVGVLLSDGFAIARDSVIEEAVRSHEAGTGMFSLGYHVKGKYSRQMLQGIGSDPDASNYMEGNSMQDMMDMMPQLIDGICQNAQACSSNPCQNGGICVEKFNTYECQCREPFTGINCERDCSGQLDLVLVIDSSGSIRQNRFDIVKAFIHNITAQLEVRAGRVQVALLTYADVATQRFQFSTFREKEDVLHAIDTLPYSRGRTNAADAIRMMQGQMFVTAAGDRGNVPNIALVFTDGYSNVQKQLTVPRAIDARIEGTHIMVVSVENEQDNLELKGMVSDPDSYNLFNVNRYADLETIVDRVVDAMCDDFNECSSNPCQNGGQCVDGLGQFICICVNQFSGVRCERECNPMRDIAIVLDASGSVDYDYSMAQDLAREVVHGLNFNNGRTKVSVVTYQSSDEVAFQLNQYNSKLEVLNALAFDNDITILGTNTAAALDTVRREVFSTANGDRNAVENWAVVISDGFSNINPGNTIQAANNLKSNGVTVVSVGLGTSVNRAEVDGIASSPESEYAYYLEDTQRLVTVASQILNQICQ